MKDTERSIGRFRSSGESAGPGDGIVLAAQKRHSKLNVQQRYCGRRSPVAGRRSPVSDGRRRRTDWFAPLHAHVRFLLHYSSVSDTGRPMSTVRVLSKSELAQDGEALRAAEWVALIKQMITLWGETPHGERAGDGCNLLMRCNALVCIGARHPLNRCNWTNPQATLLSQAKNVEPQHFRVILIFTSSPQKINLH